MFKVPKQSYTAEFKVAAVQRVEDGQGYELPLKFRLPSSHV